MTPHHSEASIIFGKGVPSPKSGSMNSLMLAVDNITVARENLIARGVDVSEVFHYAAGPLQPHRRKPTPRRARSPGRSYYSFALFKDPDGNVWCSGNHARLPGRVERAATTFASANDLASAFRRAEAAHGEHEKRTGQRDANWPDWFADYMVAEQAGTELPQ